MQDSCKVLLSDGRNVDVCTREGADIFLQTNPGENNFFTSNIGDASRIRQKIRTSGGVLSAAEKQRLTITYFTADSLARYSSPELFAKIPRDELECWIDHVMMELSEKIKDPSWTRTGILEEHDTFILNPCISMFMHSFPVLLAFEKGFFKVLSDFVASRKAPLLPCADLADTICLICSNAVISAIFNTKNPWTSDKAFKKLESCGMLAQFIRCSTIPQQQPDAIGVLKCYEELIKCPALIKKKFKKGQPCGDVVGAILNGTDGHKTKREKIMKHLEIIASFADIMQPRKHVAGEDKMLGKALKICRNCNKSDRSAEFQLTLLKSCSRCQITFYCSKECQKADWKAHKPICLPVSKSDIQRSSARQQTVVNFGKRHYAEIMERFVDVCDETGVKKSELLLELDFMPDDNGTNAPALREPPEFKIGEARGYFEGSRPNEPDWFYKKEDKHAYEVNVNNVVSTVKDHFGRMTENHVLVLVRYPGGHACYRLQLQEDNGLQMFSDLALDAFRSAINDEDFGPLSRIFDESQVRHFKKKFGMPCDSDLDQVRRMLNMMGGDFPLSGERR
jgi:hypothetical protein